MATATAQKAVQAGDDALGVDDQHQGGDNGGAEDRMGLNDQEWADFQAMREGSPVAEIDRDGEDPQVEADAAAAQAAADANAAKDAQSATDAQALADQAAKDQQTLAKATDQADDDDDIEVDPTEGGKFPQRVSYYKFKRAQERMKAAEQREREANEKLARTDERIKMIMEASGLTQQQAQQQVRQEEGAADELGPMPDPEKDIFAFASWQAKKIAQMEQHLNAVTTDIVGTRQTQDLTQRYQSDLAQYAQKTPDFNNAYQHMILSRAAELAAQQYGVDLTVEGAGSQLTAQQWGQIQRQIENEERQLAKVAFQNGRSPAEQLYIMARGRGYRPAPAQQAAGNGAAKPGNGAAATGGAPAGQPRSAVSAAVAAAKDGVARNNTLSTGGGAPGGELTREAVLGMSDAEFTRWFENATQDEKRAILGS